ncbi:MAG: type II secretion system F family protein [Bacilli bacterium]|nr:type II secretion system F family protein [Bacilli bacterium]
MPKFKFKAKDINNKIIKGVFFAKDENDLRAIVDNLDYYLISYKKIAESSQLFTFLEKIRIDEIAVFCRQLSIMVSSGLELGTAIEILKDTTKTPKLKEILETAHHDLLQGIPLSESFMKYPKTFPIFFINMIKIGEISGKLPLVLNRLADYYEKDDKVKRKVKSAFAYPIFLIGLAFVVLCIMALYVMPIFKDVFDSLNAKLPQITQVVINVTDFIRNNFLTIVVTIILLIIAFLILMRNKKVKMGFDNLKIMVPPFKDVNLTLVTSRFASGFSILLSSSMPVIDSIETMRHLLGNTYVEKQMEVTVSELKRGQGIAKSLETIDVFPPMLCEMITVGEQTGNLEEVLNRVTEYYENQVEYSMKKLTASIEPVMIMIIGLIVVVCLLAVFIPMLEITSSIDQGA